MISVNLEVEVLPFDFAKKYEIDEFYETLE